MISTYPQQIILIQKKSSWSNFVTAQAIFGVDGKLYILTVCIEITESFVGPKPKEISVLCRENGFGFVSLEDSFNNYWNQNGKLPRGFPTSRPGQGHYNSEGHRLVAEAVHDWIRKNAHVVHPD